MIAQACLFCGGDASEPDHRNHCDGRQGARLAAYDAIEAVRATDPPTSRRAADGIAPHVSRVQWRVLWLHLHAPDGLTDDELLTRYAPRWICAESSPRKRRCDLTHAGILYDTGTTRIAANGCERIVWGIVDRELAARLLATRDEVAA